MGSSARVGSSVARSSRSGQPSTAASYSIQPSCGPPTTIRCSSDGQRSSTTSTLGACSCQTMASVASALLIRYSMSLGCNSPVPGIGTTPRLMQPIMVSYQAGMRGSIMKAKSPFPAPIEPSRLAKRLDAADRSEKLCRDTTPVLASA